jgi:protein-tyrosine phosphatase
MAHYVMQHLVDKAGCADDFVIDSAACTRDALGMTAHYGTRTILRRKGIYCGNHRARLLMRADADTFDYIIGMDHENMSTLKRMKSRQPDAKSQIICLADYLQKHKGQATVPDPYYGSQRDFEFALDLIEDACEGLLKELVPSL